MVEFKVLEKMLPQMAEVMNVIPGEEFRMKERDTLLILQRRMEACELREELISFNEIFIEKKGCSIPKLRVAAVSYIKMKLLVEKQESNFSPVSYRELLKEFQVQITRVKNIIHLSQMNALAADEYQKEQIALTSEKNEAFLTAFQIEMAALEKRIERMPVPEEVKAPKEKNVYRYHHREISQADTPTQQHVSTVEKLTKKFSEAKKRKTVDVKLKEVEKEQSVTRCREIPFYDKILTFTEVISCKDIPAYCILKRKNNIYFGLMRNVGKVSYDNSDQTLLELTEATEEFLQFMTVDLLTDEYELIPFSEPEKEGLKMYFDFMCGCFRKHMGITLTVQEYLNFKAYYNRLILKMFELEKKEKEDYYKALILADAYISYMEGYDLACADDEETIIYNIMREKYGSYMDDLDLIRDNHIVDEDARTDLEDIKRRMIEFHKEPEAETKKMMEISDIPEQVPLPMPYGMYSMPMMPIGVNQSVMQIVIQILNQRREVVDEALYAGNNIRQALYDYQSKGGYIKRLGFRSNGQDVFYKEDKEDFG